MSSTIFLLAYKLKAGLIGDMSHLEDPSRIPFSARLTVSENALLLALKRHMEERKGRNVTQSDVLRAALDCLAKQEKRNGFTL